MSCRLTISAQFEAKQIARAFAHDLLQLGNSRFDSVDGVLDQKTVMSTPDYG